MCPQRPIPCSDPIDIMGGAVIPDGYSVDLIYINGIPYWETDPAQPEEELPVILVNQNDGGILIDEGIFLAI